MLFGLVALCAVLSGVLADNGDTLQLVQAVWRHGDRSPTGTFRNDPIKESDWPQGWGQLSPLGMEQHLYLGQKLAARYVKDLKFITANYKASEVYVRSTDVNRTLISAMSNFIGFYGSATKKGVDYPDNPAWPANYVPIPVHTVDDDTDYLGNPDRECPRLDALEDLWAQTKEFKSTTAANQKLLDQLTALCGERIDMYNIWLVFDALFIERTSPNKDKINSTLLSLYDQIKKLDDINDDWDDGIGLSPVNGINFTLEAPRIRGGPLLWAIINHMQGKANCIANPNDAKTHHYCKWMNPLKYYVYSAHDTTVSALFSAFGFKDSNWNETGFPHYSSCVTVELWQKQDKSFYVKVIYWPLDEADEKKRPQEDLTKFVTGCKSDTCALNDFIARSQPYKMEPSPKEYCEKTDDIRAAGGDSTPSGATPTAAPGGTKPSGTTPKAASLSRTVSLLTLFAGVLLVVVNGRMLN